jgi:hypothetical protein
VADFVETLMMAGLKRIGPTWRQASEMSETSSATPIHPFNPPRSGTVK